MWPLKNLLALPFFFPFNLQVFLLPVGHLGYQVTSYPVAGGVSSPLATTFCSQADSTPAAVSQAAGTVPGDPGSLQRWWQWPAVSMSLALALVDGHRRHG